MNEEEIVDSSMNLILANELALMEAIKGIVRIADGDAEKICCAIDGIKKQLQDSIDVLARE